MRGGRFTERWSELVRERVRVAGRGRASSVRSLVARWCGFAGVIVDARGLLLVVRERGSEPRTASVRLWRLCVCNAQDCEDSLTALLFC